MTGERIIVAVGAFVALLLQILLAPHIAIGFGLPNFLLAYCLAVAVARPGLTTSVLPFATGLAYDLLSGGPVGAMAFTLTALSSVEVAVFRRVGNDTAFMAVAVMVGGILSAEVVYGLMFLLFGYAASFSDALVYRILPCFLYDLVISLVLYTILFRLFGQGGSGPVRSEIRQL